MPSSRRPNGPIDPLSNQGGVPQIVGVVLYTQNILLVELAAVLLLVALLGALLLARRPQTESARDTGHEGGDVIPTNYVLILGAVIFTIGAIGVLTRRNALIIVMSVEMMLNSVNLTLIALSRQWNNLNGQVFVFLIMAVAAAEVAVGLAILIAHSRLSNSINVDDVDLMKW